jgi:pimeloyl-ACP methyl ester carboxylesterase
LAPTALYPAKRYPEFRKFLAGAFFVSSGVQFYFWQVRLTLPLYGKGFVQIRGNEFCARHCPFHALFILYFIKKPSGKKVMKVKTEGDEIYYEVRGKGLPLLMIPGGGGDGGAYSFVTDILSDEYKVITYDRRACARSTMSFPDHFDIAQQSRDAAAVIHAAGEESAFIFGNSSGAVIALDMAATQPQAVRGVIAHEPPLARIHPNAQKWQKFFQGVYASSFRFGNSIAMLRFTIGIGMDYKFADAFRAARTARKERMRNRGEYLDQRKVMDFFIKQELLPVTNYEPDIEHIKENRIKVIMAAGKRSLAKRRFYAEAAQILAEKLSCEFVEFPGHHGSFVDVPNEWATTLKKSVRRFTT